MSKPARIGLVLTSVALTGAIASCAAPQAKSQAATSFGGKADGDTGLAMRAMAALNANNVPAAIGFAERAVARTPDDAGFRALLGNAYFAGGRFASAEAAFKDSLSIYSNQPQVVLKLALVEIAQGKTTEAVAFLDAAREVLDPADYGLALALSGRVPAALDVLRDASRTTTADARVRQNYALVLGLSGDWDNARIVAAQDLSADQVGLRIHQWMLLAKPARAYDQVASLTGVKPAPSDPGQPVRLAWRKGDTSTASAAPQLRAQPSVTVTLPAAEPIAAAAPAPVPAPQPSETPAIAEAVAPSPPPADPARWPAFAATQEPPAAPVFAASESVPPPPPPARPAFTPAAAPRKALHVLRASVPTPRRGNSTSVVQLGAFSSSQGVAAAWNAAARRHSALRGYVPMSARFNSGRGVVYRLSVRGFASGNEAGALCASLRRSGGSCFVRTVAGDAPVQLASR